MHKFFANPLFLGKKVVFLPQCHSTNDELVKLDRQNSSQEGLVLYTDDQTKGKGQRGNVWISESGKNILMSVLLKPKFLLPNNQYYLNLITALSVVEALGSFSKKELLLKWPNDVYLHGKKVCGILIESTMQGGRLGSSVVGIGVNVNQSGFMFPNATSLKLEEDVTFERLEVMEEIIIKLEKWYLKLKSNLLSEILNSYHEILLWRGEKRMFQSNNVEFEGEIIGINSSGQLVIDTGLKLQCFSVKEVEFLR